MAGNKEEVKVGSSINVRHGCIKGSIILYDTNVEYAKNLADYSIGKTTYRTSNYNIVVFTELNSLGDFVKKNSNCLLVMSEDIIRDEKAMDIIRELSSIGIVIISEDNRQILEYSTVFRYSKADYVLSELEKVFMESLNKSEDGKNNIYHVSASNKKTKIIGVYSPVKRCGKTSFAITLAQVLGTQGQVLYLNFEDIAVLGKIDCLQSDTNLSEILYYYIADRAQAVNRIRTAIHKFKGIDYIPPVTFSTDIQCIDADIVIGVIQCIMEELEYNSIILDISSLIKEYPTLLEFCDIVYMPVLDDYISVQKVSEFFNRMILLGKADIADIIQKVTVPMLEDAGDERYYDRLLFGGLGDYIRSLLLNGDTMEGKADI